MSVQGSLFVESRCAIANTAVLRSGSVWLSSLVNNCMQAYPDGVDGFDRIQQQCLFQNASNLAVSDCKLSAKRVCATLPLGRLFKVLANRTLFLLCFLFDFCLEILRLLLTTRVSVSQCMHLWRPLAACTASPMVPICLLEAAHAILSIRICCASPFSTCATASLRTWALVFALLFLS